MSKLPIGPAPTLLLVLFVASGGWLMFLAPDGDLAAEGDDSSEIVLNMWTFATSHFEAYCEAVPAFEEAHPGVKVNVELVHGRAVTSRLLAAFWADLDAPDLVEVEINSVGMFFRGPLEDIGFVDLTDRLRESGLYDRLVKPRFSAWSSREHNFGFPHDVHPVMIAYRRDIFEEEGIDPADLDTWDKFVEAGRTITRDLDGDGTVDRYMIDLPDNNSSGFEVLLFQRGGGYFDADGRVAFDDDVAVDTMAWFVPLLAGPDRIANSIGIEHVLTQAVEGGYLICHLCPDWRTRVMEQEMPRMSGKMALMPMPAAEPGGRRTSTLGGTMLAMTKKSEHQDLAWELAMHLYYDAGQLAERFRGTNIVPPLRDAWELPAFDEPREYWSGQPIGALYASLADETPPQFASPYTPVAKDKAGEAVAECIRLYNRHGEEGFHDRVRAVLEEKADDVRRLMDRNPFL